METHVPNMVSSLWRFNTSSNLEYVFDFVDEGEGEISSSLYNQKWTNRMSLTFVQDSTFSPSRNETFYL